MLAVNQLRDSAIDLPESALLEIHRSKISLHRAKAGYKYPTIRYLIPCRVTYPTLSNCSRLSASLSHRHIALRKDPKKLRILRLHTAEIGRSNRPGFIVLFAIGDIRAVYWRCLGYADYGEKGATRVQCTPERLCRPPIYLFTASLAIAVSRRSAILSGHPR
jgi:hypothetical protein